MTNSHHISDFFQNTLSQTDPLIYDAIHNELERQQNNIELIASENIVSKAVLEAQGSILTNKYAEGYPRKRYYAGCTHVDQIETIAIDRVKKLFSCNFANVQPHSGSQANQAVLLALLKPGDTILGLSLECGGHLTHGSHVNQSGKWFNVHHYGVNKQTSLIDYDEVEELAQKHAPKLIIAGCSAYPRKLDFMRFRKIADSVGAYLMVDMAHFAGLVAVGAYDNPVPHADVVTSTTHKTLRGTRGGFIITNNEDIAKMIDKAVFPGMQGGPLMHAIAGKAVAFGEALSDHYKQYMLNVVQNANALSSTLQKRGYRIVTGGTDCHFVLLDLTPNNITGKDASNALDKVGLTCNKNTIPYDANGPFKTSGIRIGTPAGTTRGFRESEFKIIANLIADVLDHLQESDNIIAIESSVKSHVASLCSSFPIYNHIQSAES